MVTAIHGTEWAIQEIDLCVGAYFSHLEKQIKGESFNKAQLYRSLSASTGRTEKSIGLKFQNISAVLDAMGREWMTGLAPMANYQELLAEKVSQHLVSIDKIEFLPLKSKSSDEFDEATSFYLEPPPELQKQSQILPDFMDKLVRKFDPVARDAANRALGEAGEEFVFNYERRFLGSIGRDDLAKNVRWIAKEEGDGAGYDILSFSDRGDEKLVEVKTTVGGIRTPFFVSRNEYDVCRSNEDSYRVVRLYDFRKGIRGFELVGRLDRFVNLSAETNRAEFHHVRL